MFSIYAMFCINKEQRVPTANNMCGMQFARPKNIRCGLQMLYSFTALSLKLHIKNKHSNIYSTSLTVTIKYLAFHSLQRGKTVPSHAWKDRLVWLYNKQLKILCNCLCLKITTHTFHCYSGHFATGPYVSKYPTLS